MKVALLKKIRNRYSIELYRKGTPFKGNEQPYPVLALIDTKTGDVLEYFFIYKGKPYNAAFDLLYTKLVDTIKYEYRQYGTRRNNEPTIKKWYK